MILVDGTAVGYWVILVVVWAVELVMEAVCEAVVMREECGATVAAGTDWTVATGGSCPTEMQGNIK